jgi:hypothetical protein
MAPLLMLVAMCGSLSSGSPLYSHKHYAIKLPLLSVQKKMQKSEFAELSFIIDSLIP